MTAITSQNTKPKILFGYSYFKSPSYQNAEQLYQNYINRLVNAGFDVEGFCLTLNPPGPPVLWEQLDASWHLGNKDLLQMYERLEAKLEGKDILINGPGINLHPEFVERLPVYTVFQCFDDPESSHLLSKPVAAAYDMCLVGNIAELDTYRSWGCKQVEWSPMGLQSDIYDPNITEDSILNGERDIDLFMMGDRLARWRKKRMDQLGRAFPDAHFYGRGWPRGKLPESEQLGYLRRAKIGPNIHNSTGPINYRTFYLPANGVMLVCDNKKHLGEIYQLGKEAVGFDSIDECVDLCRYYLDHDTERRQIAAAGWKRSLQDYNEITVFQRNITHIQQHMTIRRQRQTHTTIALQQSKLTAKSTFAKMLLHPQILKPTVKKPFVVAMNIARKLRSHALMAHR